MKYVKWNRVKWDHIKRGLPVMMALWKLMVLYCIEISVLFSTHYYIMETQEIVSKQCKYTSLQKVHHVHNKSIYTAWHLHFLEYVVPISKVEWFVCSGTESSLY